MNWWIMQPAGVRPGQLTHLLATIAKVTDSEATA